MISEFQLALIAIAAFVIAAILAYNYWQEHRYRERAERAFKTDHPDVLLDAGDVSRPVRLEPELGELPLPEDDQVMETPDDTFALAPRSVSGGVNTAIDTVERAMMVAGGGAFYRSKGLERRFRDVQAARFHPLQEPAQLDLSGRLALGLDLDG